MSGDPSLLSVSEKSKLLFGPDGLRTRRTPVKRSISVHRLNKNKVNRPPKGNSPPPLRPKSVNFKSPSTTNRTSPGKSIQRKHDKENVSSTSIAAAETSQGRQANQRRTNISKPLLVSPIASNSNKRQSTGSLTTIENNRRDTLAILEQSNISPRSLNVIIMDNPATRAEYLARQSPSSRKPVKMYGTPQLAGRLGVDRFPNAPTHYVRAWSNGAELYSPFRPSNPG